VGATITEALPALHLRSHLLLLAVEQGGQMRVNPPPELRIEAGARLVVLKR
jgi:Trk K+ transport system NAD-binding subunit